MAHTIGLLSYQVIAPLVTDDVPFIDDDEQMVHVEPGQTVYFQYTIALSLIFEVADNQEQAAER